MKRLYVFFILIIVTINIYPQKIDSTKSVRPNKLPLWTLFVPGGSYYYQNKIGQGSLFTALELGGIYLGLKYDKDLKSNSTSPYYNYPLFIGLQAFGIEKLYNFRNQLELVKYHRPDFKYHDISEKDLYLAPFKKENVFTPITGGMVLLAGVFLGIEKYNEKNRISNVEQMYFMDRYINRDEALAIFSTTSLALSWSAGVGEEYLFRNHIMPILDYKYGQKKD